MSHKCNKCGMVGHPSELTCSQCKRDVRRLNIDVVPVGVDPLEVTEADMLQWTTVKGEKCQ